jgi:hypothetical protein
MGKHYGGLFKKTLRGVIYRKITIIRLIDNRGFYVLNEGRLSAPSASFPVTEDSPSTMLFATGEEAIAEADKNYADSIKAGFRPIEESY